MFRNGGCTVYVMGQPFALALYISIVYITIYTGIYIYKRPAFSSQAGPSIDPGDEPWWNMACGAANLKLALASL